MDGRDLRSHCTAGGASQCCSAKNGKLHQKKVRSLCEEDYIERKRHQINTDLDAESGKERY